MQAPHAPGLKQCAEKFACELEQSITQNVGSTPPSGPYNSLIDLIH